MCLAGLTGACSAAPSLPVQREGPGLASNFPSIKCGEGHGPEHRSGAFHLQSWFQGTLAVAFSSQASEALTQTGGFILRPPRATELPLNPWGPGSRLSSFASSMGSSGFSVRLMVPTICETLGKSAASPSLGFSSVKWGQFYHDEMR